MRTVAGATIVSLPRSGGIPAPFRVPVSPADIHPRQGQSNALRAILSPHDCMLPEQVIKSMPSCARCPPALAVSRDISISCRPQWTNLNFVQTFAAHARLFAALAFTYSCPLPFAVESSVPFRSAISESELMLAKKLNPAHERLHRVDQDAHNQT